MKIQAIEYGLNDTIENAIQLIFSNNNNLSPAEVQIKVSGSDQQINIERCSYSSVQINESKV